MKPDLTKKFFHQVTAIILSSVILNVLIFNLYASHHPIDSKEVKINEQYFHLLESIEADSSIDQISALQRFLEDHPKFERVYHKLLEHHLVNNRIDDAEKYFRQLNFDSRYQPNSHWILAKIFDLKNETQMAFEVFKQAFSLSAPSPALLKDFIEFNYKHDNKFSGYNFLKQLGLNPENQKIVSAMICYKNFQYDQAIEKLIHLNKRTAQDPLISYLWGDCLFKLSRFSEADSLWRLALEISRKNKDLQSEAKFLMNLGVLSHKLNKHDQALNYCTSAYDIAIHIGDLYRVQFISGIRGHIYKKSEDYQAAKKELEQAIQIASKIREYGYLANWYSFYGQSLFYLEKYSDALAAYDESEKLACKTNNKKLLIQMMLNKGDIYFHLKQNTLAMKIYQEAYDLASEENMKDQQFRAHVRIANLFFKERNYSEAKKAYERFVNFANHQPYSQNTNFYWLWKLAKIYMFEESYERAKSLYLQAYKAAKQADRKRYMAWSLLGVAEIELITGKIPEAFRLYHEVLEIAKSENNLGLLSEVYLSMGNAHKKLNDLNKAIAAYIRAADVIEQSRQNLKVEQFRIGYFSEEYKVYQKLVFCFLQRYEMSGQREDLDSLYYYDQMARSRVLQELKICNESPLNRSHNNSLNDEYRQACKQLRMMQRRIRLEAGTVRSADELDYLLSQLEAARYSLIAQRLRL
ncbi:MAG: tetratricopeptide repeat protein, partial [Candidatus Hodarchaeota archaeon]